MAEEIKCPNILNFDKQQQKYVYCGHLFRVDGTSRGKVVECPKCGSEVRLGEIDLSRQDVLLADEFDEDSTIANREGQLDLLSPQSLPDSNVDGTPAAPKQTLEPSNSSDIFAEGNLANSETGSPAPLESPSDFQFDDLGIDQPDLATAFPPETSPNDPTSPLYFAEPDNDQGLEAVDELQDAAELSDLQTPTLPPSQQGTTLRMGGFCPSCSAALPHEEVLCHSCGYHKKLQRRIRLDDAIGDDNKPSGFQLWLQNSLSEGTSVQGVLLLASGLVLGLLLLAAVITFVAYRWWAVIFLPPIALVALLTVSLLGKGQQTRETGATGWAQRSLWGMMLRVFRVTRWQTCAWPPGSIVAKKVRDPEFDDDALAELEGLDECRVIDLERSKITDVGLAYLTAFSQLRFIVLRKTQVSDEAVRRLQRAIPSAWIWH